MSVYAIGLNHTTAPLALREQFAFATQDLSNVLAVLQHTLKAEVALLSTCNRTELYLAPEQAVNHQPSATALLEQATSALAQTKGISAELLSAHSYQLHSEQPVRHAYRVASGLDSMVLGEPQILGQLKQAVRTAQTVGTLGSQLQHLFQQSFSVAKEVRTQTGLGAASVSMAAAAVRLAQRIFGDVSERRVLMIGAGEMIELCATHFAGHKPKSMTIANRTLSRGQALADQLAKQGQPAQVIALSAVPEVLGQFDIVISCTASTLPIIGLGLVQRSLAQKAAKRQAQTTMMVDLAVPRDIEPEVGQLGDVYLYTVDDLGKVVQEGRNARSAAVNQAEQIIDLRVGDFLRWQSGRRAVPIIQALQHNAQGIRQSELDKALKLLATGQAPASVLEQLSRQLTQKLMHGSLSLSQQLAADPATSDHTLQQIKRSVDTQR
jgi:glutamyl-tRNA reductase